MTSIKEGNRTTQSNLFTNRHQYFRRIMSESYFVGFDASSEDRVKSALSRQLDLHRSKLTILMQAMNEISLTMESWNARAPHLQSLHEKFKEDMLKIPALWEQNEKFLNRVLAVTDFQLSHAIDYRYNFDDKHSTVVEEGSSNSSSCSINSNNSSSYESVDQIVGHLARDWGASGEKNRKLLYEDGILKALEHVHSLMIVENVDVASASAALKVLVPGAGAGRVAIEIASCGFSVEANEYSGLLVLLMHNLFHDVMITDGDATECMFYPYLNFGLHDNWSLSRRLEQVSVEKFASLSDASDLNAEDEVEKVANRKEGDESEGNVRGTLTVTMGSFTRYSHPSYHASYDVVVTCFVIDALPLNMLDILALISHVLTPGGYWINVGPLHYHMPDMLSKTLLFTPTSTATTSSLDPNPAQSSSTDCRMPYDMEYLLDVIAASGFASLPIPSLGNKASAHAASSGHHVYHIESTYSGEENMVMKPEYYDVPLCLWKFVDPEKAIPLPQNDSNQ